MLQELTDLDFDTYFDVASSNQQSQTQPQSRDILYHDDSQNHQQHNSNSLSSLLNSNSNNNNRQVSASTYQYTQQQQQQQHQQQQQQFNLFDWDLSAPASAHQQSVSPMQMSPISSPQSSSDGYTSHSLSPQMISSPPMYTSYNSNQHIKDEANKALEGFFAKRSLYSSISHLQNVPGINIPSTPTAENTPMTAATSNLPSPPIDNPLSGAFSAIDQWCQIKDQDVVIHPLDMNSDGHETRHWRKTSARHQQLQQAQANTLERPEPGKQLKKVAHNAIERRYRNNINDRIRELKNVVPALYKARIKEKGEHDDDSSVESGDEDEAVIVEGVEVAKKLNKATILRKATEYINFLKNTNETTEQENQILQQIIAQMPGGNDVLSRFLHQKSEFEKAEQERLAIERREAQERERTERQRILRERAAQRAALAQLLPKPERRPYRRRQSSKNNAKPSKKASLSSDDGGNNKMFMAAFMCIAFFSSSPASYSGNNVHHSFNHDNQTTHSLQENPTSSSIDAWHILRYTLYVFGILYIFIIPLLLRWIRPRPVSKIPKSSKIAGQQKQTDEEPPSKIEELAPAAAKADGGLVSSPTSILSTVYDIINYTLSLPITHYLLYGFSAKSSKCSQDVSFHTCTRLNESKCSTEQVKKEL